MRPLDLGVDLIDVSPPAALYNGLWLPTFAVAPTLPTFDNNLLFDVSAFESWRLEVDLYPTPATQAPAIALSWFTGVTTKMQTIVLPAAQLTPTIILGRVLGPVLGLAFTGNLSSAGPNRIQFSVSNRTRLHDAPYTPVPLGTILATIPKANLASLGVAAVNIPYYLGPAHITAYVVGISGANPGNSALVRVHDDQTSTAEVQLAACNTNSPMSDLWIPSLQSVAGALPSTWKLSADNATTATVGFAATLTAA